MLIVTYNSSATISACLESLRSQLADGDAIVVVDNGSTDSTCDVIHQRFPEVRLVPSTNVGFGAGINLARSYARAQWLFILNPDTVVLDECISALKAQTRQDTIFAPLQLDELGRHIGAGRSADVFGYPVESKNSERIFYADGAALFLAASLFDTLGGFDDSGFLFCEDVDFSWRAWLLGYSVTPVVAARVIHRQGASIVGGKDIGGRRVTSAKRRFYTEYNLLRNMLRNYSALTLLIVLPPYFILLVGEIGVLLFSRKPAVAKGLIRAIIANLRCLKRTLTQRRDIQARRRLTDKEILHHLYFGSGKVLQFLDVGVPEFAD